MSNNEFAYETYINAPREAVWRALTNPEFTRLYFHSTRVRSSWEEGAVVEFLYDYDGKVAVEGKVLESSPPDRLVISWHVLYNEEASLEAPSRVSFTLKEFNGQTRLRIFHDRFPASSVVFDGISQGWPWIISGLKSVLETGQPLPPLEADTQG